MDGSTHRMVGTFQKSTPFFQSHITLQRLLAPYQVQSWQDRKHNLSTTARSSGPKPFARSNSSTVKKGLLRVEGDTRRLYWCCVIGCYWLSALLAFLRFLWCIFIVLLILGSRGISSWLEAMQKWVYSFASTFSLETVMVLCTGLSHCPQSKHDEGKFVARKTLQKLAISDISGNSAHILRAGSRRQQTCWLSSYRMCRGTFGKLLQALNSWQLISICHLQIIQRRYQLRHDPTTNITCQSYQHVVSKAKLNLQRCPQTN